MDGFIGFRRSKPIGKDALNITRAILVFSEKLAKNGF